MHFIFPDSGSCIHCPITSDRNRFNVEAVSCLEASEPIYSSRTYASYKTCAKMMPIVWKTHELLSL